MTPARGGTRRWARSFSTSSASERHEARPAPNTGHNPLPSQALRIFAPTICPGEDPARAGQPDDHANPLDLPGAQNAQIGMATALAGIAGARPERRLGIAEGCRWPAA